MDILKKHQKINSKQIFTIYSVPDNFLWPRSRGVYKRKKPVSSSSLHFCDIRQEIHRTSEYIIYHTGL